MAKDTRFKKGKSGNPKGKPKGARNGGKRARQLPSPIRGLRMKMLI